MNWRRPFLVSCVLAALACGEARGQFQELWTLGTDDNSQADFSQEGGVNPPPGSEFERDDDYYFAGDYDDGFGFDFTVDEDEPWINMERALVPGDPTVRVHFNLTADEAAPASVFNLLIDYFALGAGSSHDVRVLFNTKVVWSQSGITSNLLMDETFAAAEVGAVAGANVITVERTGGGAANPWIQFDYLNLWVEPNPGGCVDPVCTFSADKTFVKPGESVVLNWLANPGSSLEIDNGVGTVTSGNDGTGRRTVNPTTTTTYTLIGSLGGEMTAREVTVTVDILETFTAHGGLQYSSPVSRPGQPVELRWKLADPSAAVEIDNGIGDVSGFTNAQGVGSLVLDGANLPTGFTTYTLTATRGAEFEEAFVDVDVSEKELLFQVGFDDGTQGDFSQEGGVNEPPGDDLTKDDDYYVIGNYEDFLLGFDVPESEPWIQMERAITAWDPTVRIHFIMSAEQAAPGNLIDLDVDLISGGGTAAGTVDGPFGTHNVEVRFNGVTVISAPGIVANTLLERSVTTDFVSAIEGENIVEIERTGGSIESWIQFDYLLGEVDTSPDLCADPICDFATGAALVGPGETVELTWRVAPGATVMLDDNLGNVINVTGNTTASGIGTVNVTPTVNTLYTLISNNGGTIGTADVTVDVVLLNQFAGSGAVPLSDPVVRPGQPVTLSWSVDPSASVSIEPGIGSVDGQTAAGIGSVVVAPTVPTTYTLTVTRGADVETADVTVEVSGWQLLWQVGQDNGGQGEFSQEGTSNPPPGDHLGQDDDFYTPGDYTAFDAFIGDLPEGEIWKNFDRALTGGDPNNRIHFTMSGDQAEADNEIRLIFDMNNLGAGAGQTSSHDISVFFNGNEIITESGIVAPTILEATVRAGDVGAAAGHNVVEVSRTGGEGGWIQFDFTTGEVRTPVIVEGDLKVTLVDFDTVLGGLSVTWTSQTGKSYRIETSTDLKTWTAAKSGISAAFGADTTTESIDLGVGYPEETYVRVVEE